MSGKELKKQGSERPSTMGNETSKTTTSYLCCQTVFYEFLLQLHSHTDNRKLVIGGNFILSIEASV